MSSVAPSTTPADFGTADMPYGYIDEGVLATLAQLPVAHRVTILENLTPLTSSKSRTDYWWSERVPAFSLLLGVMHEFMAVNDATEMFERVKSLFDELDPVLLYRELSIFCGQAGNDSAIDWLRQWVEPRLLAAMTAAGYRYGEVGVRSHAWGSWFEVKIDGVCYICEIRSDYSPRPGEMAAFLPNVIQTTAKNVAVPEFIPLAS